MTAESTVTAETVTAETATAEVATPAAPGRPKAASTMFVFSLLEQNPDAKYADVAAEIQAAGFEVTESSFNVKKSQFKNRNKVSAGNASDADVEARRANRNKINKLIAKMAALKNPPSYSTALEKLQAEGLTISAPSFYAKMKKFSGGAAPAKATKSTTKKAASSVKPAKTMSNEAVLQYVLDNGGIAALQAKRDQLDNVISRALTLAKGFGLSQ